jgi:hypothetical protein
MAAALDLSELPTEALVKEMERRLDCLKKPEKRLVLIGEFWLEKLIDCNKQLPQILAEMQ